jgi:glycosyltransferase involved in cell wall biosynthesis
MISVIIPASNEARILPACLDALLTSTTPHVGVEVVVVSNGSRDATAEVARSFGEPMRAGGWELTVLDLPEGGKLGALNAGDRAARGDVRVYLDADVTVSPRLLAGIGRVLDRSEPAYASGQPVIRARGPVSQAYARLWARVPFMTAGVPGCGLFAVNATGRARWDTWPAIIADDLFARLNFAPHERHLVHEPYDWPIAEGFSALTRVRRRQDRGAAEVAERFPHLLANEDKVPLGTGGLAGLAWRDPLGFLAYAGVALAVRARRADGAWVRGR